MRTIGNLLLIPIKLVFLIGYIFSIIGIIITTIFEHISTIVIGTFISLCLIIIIASLILYGSSIKESPASMMVVIAFTLSVVITLIPFAFKGLLSFFKKGLAFWF